MRKYIFICTLYSVYIVFLSAAVAPDEITVDPLSLGSKGLAKSIYVMEG